MNKYIDVINFNDAKNIIIENDLNTDDLTDYTVGLYVNNKLVGTGSLYKNIIKLVAIKKLIKKKTS
jgi:citrate lyase synthetase